MPKEDPFVNRAQLLKAIKKYPEIWDSNNKLHMCRSVTSPMWNEIAEQFGGLVPTVKLQSIWSQMKYHYHNLVHRQILHKERFTTKWEHFEPMSFMYSITVAKIVNAASPSAEAQAQPSTAPAAATGTPATSAVPPPPAAAAPPSSTITSSSQLLQHQQPVPSAMAAVQGRGRPSGSFAWMPQPTAQHQQPQQPPQHLGQHGAGDAAAHPTDESGAEATVAGSGAGPAGFTVFTGLVPPAAVTVETRTTPHVRKPGRPVSMNNSMRGRIIDVIKAHPALWAGKMVGRDQRQGQNRTSAVWKEVAAELGLTPSLVQTRWSIIKQRYVDELQKERHALYLQQEFHSTWEHFERIAFMRDILMKKVDEREQTREQIQEIVSEQQQLQNQHMRYHHHHQQQQQQQHQAQQHHHQGQQQPQHHHNHHHQQHQHHHGQPQQHPDGAVRSAGAGSPPPSSSPGLHHHGALCDDPGNVDVVGMLPVHPVGRRRVKTESDLEWDPFEMILHVHGAEPTNN